MRTRALTCALLACSVAFLLDACSVRPLPATATPSPEPPTSVPTVIPSPTATSKPSPTLPAKPQLIREITLRPFPGVGRNPQAVAVLGDRAYVANRSTHNVSVLEGGKVSATIPVGEAPIDIAADSRTGLVYVANEGDESISFISGHQVVKTVPGPKSVACVIALDGRLYAGGRGENAIVVLDGVSGERIAAVPVQAPIGILTLAVNPTNELLYASAYDAIHIVDLSDLAVVSTLEREVYLTLGTDPASERFFVSEYDPTDNAQYLVAFDALGQEVVGRVQVGGDPRGMAVDPAGGRIYVANSWTNDLSIIDGQALELITTVPIGLRPLDVAVGDAGQVYVVNAGSDNVAVVDGKHSSMSGIVPLAMLPLGMAVDTPSGRLFVACGSTNSVFAVANGQVQAELSAGLHPSEVALSPGGQVLAVLNYVGGDLLSISTQDGRLIKTVDVGARPQGLAAVAEMGQVYASDTVLDEKTHSLIRDIELLTIYGTEVKPVDVQVDPKTGRGYMVASNGVPGSNSGLMVYVVDLRSGKPIEAQVGGLSMTDLALDPAGKYIFSTAGRFGYFQLIVNDASSLERVATLELPKYPAALTYNPRTHHLFIYLTQTITPGAEPGAEVWVLDSRGLGTVAKIPVPSERDRDAQEWYYRAPYAPGSYNMVVDSEHGLVYLADAQRGTVWMIQDTVVAIPPSPTPTDTPTPWPTLTPRPESTPTATAVVESACERAAGPPLEPYWSSDPSLRLGLGCPVEELQSGPMAEQIFERGHMFWRAADRSVFVLYGDGVWRSFHDRWSEGMPEFSCEASPPDDLQQPKRGFGLVWCVEEGVKEGLGWAADGERGHDGMWQPFEHGQMIISRMHPRIYALFDDGTYGEYSTH